jgi:hypothetical protein
LSFTRSFARADDLRFIPASVSAPVCFLIDEPMPDVWKLLVLRTETRILSSNKR